MGSLLANPARDIIDGRTVVTTAGTRVQLSTTSRTVLGVAITAETDNTGVVVVGSDTVVASQSTRRGIPLNPGDTITLDIGNLQEIYLDSAVNGDGVTYTALVS